MRVRIPDGPGRHKYIERQDDRPCTHLGVSTGEMVKCKGCPGKDDKKPVHACAIHGECLPNGSHPRLKSCHGCPEREAVWQEPSKPGIIVPQPPPLNLKPRSDKALVTVVVGEDAEKLFAISGPYMKAYAERVGADFVVLDWPGHPAWPMSAKYAIGRVLDHYERIAYCDADVLLRPNAVNLFDLCAPDEFGAHDELPYSKAVPQYLQESRYKETRRRLGFKSIQHVPWYLNAGVIVAPKSYQHFLLPPTYKLLAHHCSEQDHLNARLHDAAAAGDIRYRILDRRSNHQNWTDFGMKCAPADAVLHYSGGGEVRRRRLQDMAAMAAKHPLFVPDNSTNHAWNIDVRHLHWLHAVLATGRFKRVLEIGCFLGYSTQAFIAAPAVVNVHLCDVDLRLKLEHRLKGKPVTFHQERSTDLLTRDAAWDMVFVDGDHTLPVVAEESRLLLAAGVPAIFAHDTGDNPSMGRTEEGPGFLKDTFRTAGYHWFEDAERRPGELTDRGMFWAAKDRATFEAGMDCWRKHGATRRPAS